MAEDETRESSEEAKRTHTEYEPALPRVDLDDVFELLDEADEGVKKSAAKRSEAEKGLEEVQRKLDRSAS